MFDFLKYRNFALTISLLVATAFVGIYFYKGKLNYSVEFTGGTQVLLSFESPIKSGDLLSVIEKQWEGAIVREFSDKKVLIRVKEFVGDTKGLADRMKESVQKAFEKNKVTIDSTDAVGPGVGEDLRSKSIRAVLLALLFMLLYIAIRFRSMSFAVGSVVALLHDAVMMLGMFLILNREISTSVIAAILAVLGYSINDTIVIFSRIRSNVKKMNGASLYEIVNISLNQTFKRTLLTSVSTLLTVGPLLILGGEVLRDFSLALLMGIFFGTYSSIYIASPIMLLLYKEEKK